LKRLGSPQQIDEHLLKILDLLKAKDHFLGPNYPQGLDTQLRRGRLSGGEKRTVANTRAMVASPAIMLLDEFTAGLDAWNERAITQALIDDRPKGQTVIAVAQTLSTIQAADKIIFVGSGACRHLLIYLSLFHPLSLSPSLRARPCTHPPCLNCMENGPFLLLHMPGCTVDGTIKEEGTWDELVAMKGGFAEFVRIQSLVGKGDAAADGASLVSALDSTADATADEDGTGSEEEACGAENTLVHSDNDARTSTSAPGSPVRKTSSSAARWPTAQINFSVASRIKRKHNHSPETETKEDDVRATVRQLVVRYSCLVIRTWLDEWCCGSRLLLA
jgi:energy-coupling factor transporter ATP-binding protein EcfA2